MTPQLSLGGEVFRSGQDRKSGVGFAARYETDKMVNVSSYSEFGQLTTYQISSFFWIFFDRICFSIF